MRTLLALPVLVVLIAATACSSSKGANTAATTSPAPSVTSSATTSTGSAADTAEITHAWEAFFVGTGPVAAHAALLENGSSFTAALTSDAEHPTPGVTAKVLSVVVNGQTAAVTYDLLGPGGTKLLPGAQGKAVKQGGVWKVSKFTYCQLKELQGIHIVACS